VNARNSSHREPVGCLDPALTRLRRATTVDPSVEAESAGACSNDRLVEATLVGQQPRDVDEAGRVHQMAQLGASKRPMDDGVVSRDPAVLALAGDEEMGTVAALVEPFPELVNDPPAIGSVVDARSLEPGSLHQGAVVVADRDQQATTGAQSGRDRTQGGEQVVGGVQVRQRVVDTEHGIEAAAHGPLEVAHVRDHKPDRQAPACRLLTGPADGARTEVARGNAVAERGQAERLGSDAAGAVQDIEGRGSVPDKRTQNTGLALEGGGPVGEDEMMVGR
jgi:hypothetical protein